MYVCMYVRMYYYYVHVYVDTEERHTKYLLDWQQYQEESYLTCEQKLDEIKVSRSICTYSARIKQCKSLI